MFSTGIRAAILCAAAALVTTAVTGTASAAAAAASREVVAYYQTQYSNGAYVSPAPLRGIATDVEVGALHLNDDGSVHLNDEPPSAEKFARMWSDLAALHDSGGQISWYNVQFYCGWGSLGGTGDYDGVLGSFPASRIVAGTVTNPANCGGYVDPGALANTLRSLSGAHPDLGGAAGWEYFNSVGVNGGPETWYQNVKSAMGS